MHRCSRQPSTLLQTAERCSRLCRAGPTRSWWHRGAGGQQPAEFVQVVRPVPQQAGSKATCCFPFSAILGHLLHLVHASQTSRCRHCLQKVASHLGQQMRQLPQQGAQPLSKILDFLVETSWQRPAVQLRRGSRRAEWHVFSLQRTPLLSQKGEPVNFSCAVVQVPASQQCSMPAPAS